MNRKKFIKNTLLGAAGAAVGKGLISKSQKEKRSTYDQLMDQVGFNHLPNQELKTMKTVLHKANTRGHADHGWLRSYHSFSFANYYNPERMHFGVLRVLNDDVVQGGKGFGMHPHDNMEIISIPLSGDLEHKDSMGNTAVIRQGDVQVMSAGTGIYHSEFNKSGTDDVAFLQIWMFPNKKDVTPRYDQISLSDNSEALTQILSPNAHDAGVWVHQDAWFHMVDLAQQSKANYQIKKEGNGVYAFVLEGNVSIEGQALSRRDGFGLWDIDQVEIQADSDVRVLLMDVPMVG